MLVMLDLISYLQFVFLFELNGTLTRFHLQGLILWALLEVITSLWPRKVGLRDLFKANRAKLGFNFYLAKDKRKILVNGNPLTQSC